MNRNKLKQSIILFMAATIWGFAFVAQSVGMDYVGPYTFIAARNVVALAVLLPWVAVMDRGRRKKDKAGWQKEDCRTLLIGGICCGICLFAASALQQTGMKYTTLAVVVALAGLYLLCMTKGDFHVQKGDLYILGCAAVFSVHILVVDHFSPLVDGVKLSCVQFAVNAVLGTVMMLLLERPDMSALIAAWLPIVYAGALSSGLGYTFQIIGQKGMNPTAASLILSLESVISVLAGWLLLHQALTVRELFGCTLVFAAIILVQLPVKEG